VLLEADSPGVAGCGDTAGVEADGGDGVAEPFVKGCVGVAFARLFILGMVVASGAVGRSVWFWCHGLGPWARSACVIAAFSVAFAALDALARVPVWGRWLFTDPAVLEFVVELCGGALACAKVWWWTAGFWLVVRLPCAGFAGGMAFVVTGVALHLVFGISRKERPAVPDPSGGPDPADAWARWILGDSLFEAASAEAGRPPGATG